MRATGRDIPSRPRRQIRRHSTSPHSLGTETGGATCAASSSATMGPVTRIAAMQSGSPWANGSGSTSRLGPTRTMHSRVQPIPLLTLLDAHATAPRFRRRITMAARTGVSTMTTPGTHSSGFRLAATHGPGSGAVGAYSPRPRVPGHPDQQPPRPASVRAGQRLAHTSRTQRDSRCGTWFGADVAAVVCTPRLGRTVRRGRLGRRGHIRVQITRRDARSRHLPRRSTGTSVASLTQVVGRRCRSETPSTSPVESRQARVCLCEASAAVTHGSTRPDSRRPSTGAFASHCRSRGAV